MFSNSTSGNEIEFVLESRDDYGDEFDTGFWNSANAWSNSKPAFSTELVLIAELGKQSQVSAQIRGIA